MLDKIEIIDKPQELNDKMNIKLEPNVVSGNDVLTISGLSKSFDDVTLLTILILKSNVANVLPLLVITEQEKPLSLSL